MTATGGGTSPETVERPKTDETAASPRRRLLALAAAAVLVVVALAVLLVTRGDDDEPGGAAADPTATSSATPTPTAVPTQAPPATPTPEEPLPASEALPPSLAPVGLDQTAAVGDGVTVDVVALEAIDGTASGPGNVSGPALRVTLRVTNGTEGRISLNGTFVELRYGFDQAAASPLEDESRLLFNGEIDPGATTEGIYVFGVPTDSRGDITVSVGYAPGKPFVVFSGSAD